MDSTDLILILTALFAIWISIPPSVGWHLKTITDLLKEINSELKKDKDVKK